MKVLVVGKVRKNEMNCTYVAAWVDGISKGGPEC